jgi:periplasmic protein TonB
MRVRRVVRRLMLASFVSTVLGANARLDARADGLPQAAGTSTTQATADSPWPPAGVFRVGRGITAPRIIKPSRPSYPADAMRAKVQGKVVMEAVVQADGTVGEVRVQQSLDRKFGVDDAAVKAVKEMRFAPATKDGLPVPVVTQIEMSFAAK